MTTSGKQLGRYELLEQLGEGGMGAVWLARLQGSHGFEKLCIVKTVLPSIAKDAEFVSRFLHEGRVLTQLSHGNIAQVLDMNETDGQLFLALEYVAGVDLAKLAENVRASGEFMPTSLIIALIAQAAEGLGAAHRKTALDGTPLHIVHRDVSPQNIMASYEGEVKVIDFGIAKSEARSRHTAQSSVMGKLGYMAPEQARGENVDHRADQYALAIVLWELLANQPFVRRGTLTEMVVAMANPVTRPIAPLRGDVPPSLEAVVTKALAPNRDERFTDTDAFARALTGEVLALGPPPTKPQLGEYVKTKCTQEFGNQRALLTRVSTMRAISNQAVQSLSSDPLAATAVRPGPPIPSVATLEVSAPQPLTVPARPASQPTEPPPSRSTPTKDSIPATTAPIPPPPAIQVPQDPLVAPLTTGEIAAAAMPKRSKLPLIIGGVLLVAVLGAVAIAMRPVDETQHTPVSAIDAGVSAPVAVVIDAGLAGPNPPLDDIAPPPPQPTPNDGPIGPPPGFEDPPPATDAPAFTFLARSTGSSWVLTITGRGGFKSCTLTAPGQKRVKLGNLPGGMSREVKQGGAKFDAAAPKLERQLRLDCAEGFGLAKL
ncbi:MAG: serine/threonine-protein kinase [Archangium sp.]